MRSMSWKLGQVAGIDLYLHPTFLILLAYVWVNLGGPLGVILTLATFGCVLLHELGHSLTARLFGIGTHDITLYPIGGVARLERMPRAPGAELLIALAGPAVNVAIAAMLWLAGLAIGPIGHDLVMAFVSTLMSVNLILALFNMIPAFPMDGGRVLRALLSGWLGRLRATEIAAGLGRALAVTFGAYCLFSEDSSFFQLILAGFVYLAAGAELHQVYNERQNRPPGGGGRRKYGWASTPHGFRWVYGGGTWKLAPIPVDYDSGASDRRYAGRRGPWA